MPHKRAPKAEARRQEKRARISIDTALREQLGLPVPQNYEGYPVPLIEALALAHQAANDDGDVGATASSGSTDGGNGAADTVPAAEPTGEPASSSGTVGPAERPASSSGPSGAGTWRSC